MTTVHTLTLNPVIDLIYRLPSYSKGGTVRCEEFDKIPAGKGFSVAYALANLGVPSQAYAPLGKNDRPVYQEFCDRHSIKLISITDIFNVRQHCTILESDSGTVTHIQSTGNKIPKHCVDKLLNELYGEITMGDIVCISGSLPLGIDRDAYKTIISECKKSGATVILDTSGIPLKEAVQAHPYAIKLNQHEAEELTGHEITSYQSAYSVLQAIYQRAKIPLIIVSLGEKGLIGGSEVGVWQMSIPVEEQKIVDTVGCGDSMVAGLVQGMLEEWDLQDTLQHAIATATAAAFQVGPGMLEKSMVGKLTHRIESKQFGEL